MNVKTFVIIKVKLDVASDVTMAVNSKKSTKMY